VKAKTLILLSAVTFAGLAIAQTPPVYTAVEAGKHVGESAKVKDKVDGVHQPVNEHGLLDSIGSSLKTQTATWLVAFGIGLLTLFSSRITEKVKFALNRADQRTKQYEELATEVSQYIFSAELNAEFIEHGWTTKATMTGLLKDYNESITALRKKEFVYLSWIKKFWGENKAGQFEFFMKSVREFDSTVHSLNDEFEEVNIKDSKPKIDPNRAEQALKVMKPAINNMRKQGTKLLMALE